MILRRSEPGTPSLIVLSAQHSKSIALSYHILSPHNISKVVNSMLVHPTTGLLHDHHDFRSGLSTLYLQSTFRLASF